jgi:hypothetical protein
MFTQAGANKMIGWFSAAGAPKMYWGVTAARALFQGAALATHVVAVELYGK